MRVNRGNISINEIALPICGVLIQVRTYNLYFHSNGGVVVFDGYLYSLGYGVYVRIVHIYVCVVHSGACSNAGRLAKERDHMHSSTSH